MPNDTKLCYKCGESKSLDKFAKDRHSKDSLQSRCRICQASYRDRECPKKRKDRRLQNLYGITLEAYNNMLSFQSSGCAVCGSDKKLVLDHDHNNGQVRAILCNDCNLALGRVKDNPQTLLKLVDYLIKHSKKVSVL